MLHMEVEACVVSWYIGVEEKDTLIKACLLFEAVPWELERKIRNANVECPKTNSNIVGDYILNEYS